MSKYDARKEDIIHEGFLTKEGGSFKSWKKRFCLLTKETATDKAILRYYEPPGNYLMTKPKGEIIASGASVVVKPSSQCPSTFTIYPQRKSASHSKKNREYYLRADSNQSMDAWIEKLASVGANGPAVDKIRERNRLASIGKDILTSAFDQKNVQQPHQPVQAKKAIAPHIQPLATPFAAPPTYAPPPQQQQQYHAPTMYIQQPRVQQPAVQYRPQPVQPHYHAPTYNQYAAPPPAFYAPPPSFHQHQQQNQYQAPPPAFQQTTTSQAMFIDTSAQMQFLPAVQHHRHGVRQF